MKNETGGKEIWKGCFLRAKQYSFKMVDEEETKKAKGVREYVVKGEITFEDYYECFKDTERKHMVTMSGLRRNN
jgi:hypothetical protein